MLEVDVAVIGNGLFRGVIGVRHYGHPIYDIDIFTEVASKICANVASYRHPFPE
jgi:hypothetical protein